MTALGPRTRAALAGALLALTSLAAVLVDADWRRSERASHTAQARAIVRLTGLPDLALSSSARWLRHPGQAEPGAPFSDLPASLDVEPAGALLGPPRAVLAVGGTEFIVRRR